jgi:hypothetical protein
MATVVVLAGRASYCSFVAVRCPQLHYVKQCPDSAGIFVVDGGDNCSPSDPEDTACNSTLVVECLGDEIFSTAVNAGEHMQQKYFRVENDKERRLSWKTEDIGVQHPISQQKSSEGSNEPTEFIYHSSRSRLMLHHRSNMNLSSSKINRSNRPILQLMPHHRSNMNLPTGTALAGGRDETGGRRHRRGG